jgi:hypothetical protein
VRSDAANNDAVDAISRKQSQVLFNLFHESEPQPERF